MNRNRIIYAFLVVAVVIAGLASRRFNEFFPTWINLYMGDALWSLMVYLLIGFWFRKKSPVWVAVIALAFSFCIEFSQLYHALWIDGIRSTRLGGLVLGFGFLWSDLVCYSAGVFFGFLMERILLKRQTT